MSNFSGVVREPDYSFYTENNRTMIDDTNTSMLDYIHEN
jgi:hypothetical protein